MYTWEQRWSHSSAYDTFVVTSQYSIEEIFGDDEKTVEALKRRFKVIHLPFKMDVIRCEKLRGGANNLWSVDVRMGKPTHKCIFIWIHRIKRRTWGTETSQYLEERKSTETPEVVASETGPGQWVYRNNQNKVENLTKDGDSPVRVKIYRFYE